MENDIVDYIVKISKCPAQIFYASRDKMEKVRKKYDSDSFFIA